LLMIFSFAGLSSADWNILNQRKSKSGLRITLKNYCEAWRLNVELHNVRDFDVVPEECVDYVWKYVTSSQYKADSERTVEEIRVYLSTGVSLKKDGTDAWIFDVDDTLLSTLPFYKRNGFGGVKVNLTTIDDWKLEAKAPALEYSLGLFNHLKDLGIQTFLVSSRSECLRAATADNLVDVGYHGWSGLILRGGSSEYEGNNGIQRYKAEVRKGLIDGGYRIWGILGDQWSSIEGPPYPKRSFKLPNPIYYVA
ncbi:hypothetical protein M569_15067, partial [Genlisea aurea]